MKADKYSSGFSSKIYDNVDIIIFTTFIILVILSIIFKYLWLFVLCYIIAVAGYIISFIPVFKRKNEDERFSFLYYRANTYAFIATLIFIIAFVFSYPFISPMSQINITVYLNIILCFAISSYNLFYLYLKRKY